MKKSKELIYKDYINYDCGEVVFSVFIKLKEYEEILENSHKDMNFLLIVMKDLTEILGKDNKEIKAYFDKETKATMKRIEKRFNKNHARFNPYVGDHHKVVFDRIK